MTLGNWNDVGQWPDLHCVDLQFHFQFFPFAGGYRVVILSRGHIQFVYSKYWLWKNYIHIFDNSKCNALSQRGLACIICWLLLLHSTNRHFLTNQYLLTNRYLLNNENLLTRFDQYLLIILDESLSTNQYLLISAVAFPLGLPLLVQLLQELPRQRFFVQDISYLRHW